MTISITLRYFAILRDQSGCAAETITTEVCSARELYHFLAARYGFKLPAERVGVAVNNHFAAMEVMLADGDEVVFIPPVAGG